jgi:ring-1,2-phenylacetyl-CoA epoxidase subunit PaaD
VVGARLGARLSEEEARRVAGEVRDPEMPMLTLADLGVLRDVAVEHRPGGAAGDRVVVTLTPTYSGCPALATMRDDVVHRLCGAGAGEVEVRVALAPAWSTDWITERGRAALREAGVSAPGPARGGSTGGPVPLTLLPVRRAVRCPRCEAADVETTSEFGPTACTALYRCRACREPFEHVKEI